MLSTDKPVYQPGQSVHARGLALRRPDLNPQRMNWRHSHSPIQGQCAFKQERPTSRFGIAAMDCPLAAEIAEGQYQLTCRVGTVESHSAIDVRRYVLPKFKLDVSFDKAFYKPGDLVKGTITGGYFFGQPVADGTVTMEVRADDPRQTLSTNAWLKPVRDGKVEFEFKLPARMAGRPQDQGDARFSLAAILRDTAGQESGKTASRLVTARDFHVEIIPEGGPVVPGLDNLVYVYVSSPDGSPFMQRLRPCATMSKRKPRPMMLAWPSLACNRRRWLGSIHHQADQGVSETFVRKLDIESSGDFLVRTDKAVYVAGQSLLTTVIGQGQQPVFVDLIRDGQTIRTDTVDLQNGRGILAFDIPTDSRALCNCVPIAFAVMAWLFANCARWWSNPPRNCESTWLPTSRNTAPANKRSCDLR